VDRGGLRSLLEVGQPIGLVDKVFPARVLGVMQFHCHERAALRHGWLTDKLHPGFARCAAALADIAGDASTNDVFPTRGATPAFRQHVVKRKFAGGKTLAAILAAIGIAGEYVPPIKSKAMPWPPVAVR
jgi:hypothetical protein